MNEFAEITKTIEQYFEGLYFCDTEKLQQVFHSDAHYNCLSDGELLQLTMNEYLAIVDQRVSPASKNEQRNDKILSIELAGPDIAMAKVQCTIFPKHFTDFLSFIRINSQWKIITKVFHYELDNGANQCLM